MYYRASLVVQWLRIHLPMQETRVWALVREDPTCRGTTKPVCHNYWACALEPTSHNYWRPRATTTEAHAPRARAPQQEKPQQWEACTLQQRVAPARRNQRKARVQQRRPKSSQKKKKKYYRSSFNLFMFKEWRYFTLVPWRSYKVSYMLGIPFGKNYFERKSSCIKKHRVLV